MPKKMYVEINAEFPLFTCGDLLISAALQTAAGSPDSALSLRDAMTHQPQAPFNTPNILTTTLLYSWSLTTEHVSQ